MNFSIEWCGCQIEIFIVDNKYANIIIYRQDKILYREVCDYNLEYPDRLNALYQELSEFYQTV